MQPNDIWHAVMKYGIDTGFDRHCSTRDGGIVHYRCRYCGHEFTVQPLTIGDMKEISHHVEFHFSHCPEREGGQP